MKKALKVLGITLLVFLSALVGFGGYRFYKIKTFKDTHDLEERIATKCNKFIGDKKSVGLAIGIIQDGKIYSSGFGYSDRDSRTPVDTNTVFEIGSITKVFTAELAQILADKGTIKWDENIYNIFPPQCKPLTNDSTTLLSLATHTSGFPKTPGLLLEGVKNRCNPYSDMNRSDYESCIRNLTGKKKPDSSNFEYSNMGFSVLANCLEIKAGGSYDSLLEQEMFGVLGMRNTTLLNTDTLNFATGYDKNGNKTCHWDFAEFYGGCGAIRSTIKDMLKFLEANLADSKLYKPFSETQKQVYKFQMAGVGKGWEIRNSLPGSDKIIWHNGGTGGFKSFIGLIPEKKVGIIVLSNQSNEELDPLGFDMVVLASRVSLK